jgi:ketosteroid isomerase-like protein
MPAPTNEQQHPVEVAVEVVDEAYNRGDLEVVLDFYEDNAVMVVDPSGTLARGKVELRRAFEQVMAAKGSAKQLKTRVIEADGIALFISHWTYSGADPSGTAFVWQLTATTVFRKQGDGRWRALIDNSFGPAVLGQSPSSL